MLVALEGPDGGGKTSIAQYFAEKGAKTIKYPTRNFSLLADYLEGNISLSPKSVFLLFLADILNDQESLKGSELIILDRYVFSTIAYEVDGISYDDAKTIVESVGVIKPDVVLYLDLPVDISLERKKKQKKLDKYEGNPEYLKKVRLNFEKLYSERFLTSSWYKIDASKDLEEVISQIENVLRSSRT